MNEDKKFKQVLFSIGLAKKAGKVISGTDSVCDEIRKNKVILAICPSDISDNTKKKISDCCKYHQVKLCFCEFSKEILGNSIGKSFSACVGITDRNLSELISRNL